MTYINRHSRLDLLIKSTCIPKSIFERRKNDDGKREKVLKRRESKIILWLVLVSST